MAVRGPIRKHLGSHFQGRAQACMKLVFPGGEHPQVLLGQGINRIGSDPGSTIVLDRPGVQPQHCQLHVTAHGVMLDVPRGTMVWVNDRQVDGLISLRAGDTIVFEHVRARLASMEGVTAVGAVLGLPGVTHPSANDDPGITAVRVVLPKYVLRGIDSVGGRNFAVHGVATVGRANDCALHLDEPGISRVHARLLPTDDGVQIEDMGSTNGSFINGRRVLRALAKPGDEVAFDGLRFRVSAPGQAEAVKGAALPAASPSRPRLAWPPRAVLAVLGLALIVLLGFAVPQLMR
ncbi:FHA domain-containing protein [Lysobacter koreensis]|uniref:FHA domain-containing protein n=1 Tax=Lysobacter koreensis TaxID=266122 RepID=A0ABW2YM17_9GAMM